MKTFLVLTLSLFTQLLSAQFFTEVIPSPFEQLRSSTINFADADGDGDDDVLISGSLGLNLANVNILYLNDGAGNFNEVTGTPFAGLTEAVIFSDLNGDGNPDVLLSGRDANFNPKLSFYVNDGMANFSEVTGLSIQAIVNGDMAISDVDNDGDPDIMVSGFSVNNSLRLYLNDGMANFTVKSNPAFVGVDASSIGFSDVDGDGDEDALVLGLTSNNPSLTAETNLYLNDGMGNFTLVANTPFDGLLQGAIAFSDVDSDGDADVLILGFDDNTSKSTKLFTNDGMGNFTASANNPFVQVSSGFVTFADVDNDGDDDILISGNSVGSSISTKIYLNDGMGDFTESAGTVFPGLSGSSGEFSDIDRDGDLDLIISGYSGQGQPELTKLYLNDIYPCAQQIFVDNSDPLDLTILHADISITTIGNVNILSGNNVVFKAGESITLNPEFTVEGGSEFQAIIEECISASNRITQDKKVKNRD